MQKMKIVQHLNLIRQMHSHHRPSQVQATYAPGPKQPSSAFNEFVFVYQSISVNKHCPTKKKKEEKIELKKKKSLNHAAHAKHHVTAIQFVPGALQRNPKNDAPSCCQGETSVIVQLLPQNKPDLRGTSTYFCRFRVKNKSSLFR